MTDQGGGDVGKSAAFGLGRHACPVDARSAEGVAMRAPRMEPQALEGLDLLRFLLSWNVRNDPDRPFFAHHGRKGARKIFYFL